MRRASHSLPSEVCRKNPIGIDISLLSDGVTDQLQPKECYEEK